MERPEIQTERETTRDREMMLRENYREGEQIEREMMVIENYRYVLSLSLSLTALSISSSGPEPRAKY
jgi:hypothetical protein